MKSTFLLLSFILFHRLSFSQHPVVSLLPNAITILPASDAIITNGLRNTPYQNLERDPKVFAIQGWKSPDQSITWDVNVREKGAYRVALLVEVKGLSSNTPVAIQLSAKAAKISVQIANTQWDKIFFPETLLLDAGFNRLQLQMVSIPKEEYPDVSIYSIELATEPALQQNMAAVEKLRSKPEWLTKAKYGLFFHWNARSKPRRGEAKSYADAVKDFDVEKFASMVHEIGADFIVLTTSWDLSTFPAPLKSLDSIMPGNTTARDLIADLSHALSGKGIKLLVYCNFRINRMGWKKEDRFNPTKMDSVFNKLISIYSEIGRRYSGKIGGFWIDDGMALYPYNAPFEALARAMKQEDKDIVISYNSWIYPRFTDLQDFYCGEQGITLEAAGKNRMDLPRGGNGYFISGPQQGLKATFCGLLEPGDWTHTTVDQDIPSPLLNAEDLIKIVREAISRKNVAIMNVQVYQDGSISSQTFGLLKQLNKSVHK